jgi:hypothetical protein
LEENDGRQHFDLQSVQSWVFLFAFLLYFCVHFFDDLLFASLCFRWHLLFDGEFAHCAAFVCLSEGRFHFFFAQFGYLFFMKRKHFVHSFDKLVFKLCLRKLSISRFCFGISAVFDGRFVFLLVVYQIVQMQLFIFFCWLWFNDHRIVCLAQLRGN